MSRPQVRSATVAPKKKGPRSEGKTRLPIPLKEELRKLTELHNATENDEIITALTEYLRRHDPATCTNLWCEANRNKRGG